MRFGFGMVSIYSHLLYDTGCRQWIQYNNQMLNCTISTCISGSNNQKLTHDLSKLSINQSPETQYPQTPTLQNTYTSTQMHANDSRWMSSEKMGDDVMVEEYDQRIDYLDKLRTQQQERRRLQLVVHQLLAQTIKLKHKIRGLQQQQQGESRPVKWRRPVYQDKKYQCKFPNCPKTYGSDVSVNLHMRLKHNYGTRQQRQEYALQIFKAQQQGRLFQVLSKNTVVFLPGELEQYRSRSSKPYIII